MADPMDALKQANDEAEGVDSSQAATPAPQAAPVQPLSAMDQLKQSNDQADMEQNGGPSITDQIIEAGKSFGRGAIENAKNVSNVGANIVGAPAPFQTPPEALQAEAEAIASGATLGFSRIAERLILNNQEDQARRAKNNQDLVNFGNTIGGVGLIAATGGSGSLLEAAGAKGLGKIVLGSALDATGLGAGQIVSDEALGDPDLNAQKIASAIWDQKGNLALSALFGSVIGVAAHGISSGLSKTGLVKGAIPELIEGHQSETSLPIINSDQPPVEIDPQSPQAAEYQQAIKSTNIAQMEASLAKARAMGLTTELPQKSAVIDAESRLGDLQLPLNQIQVDSLDSQGARDQLGILKQLRTKGGGTLADFESAQKAERLLGTDNAIKNLAPGAEVTSDLHDAGQNAIKSFTDNYQARQQALAPILNDIKQFETENPFGHQAGVVEAMANRVPGVASMFDTTGPEVEIKPYSTLWGIDKATYDAVSQSYKALEEPAFIQELMNVRSGLDQNINVQQAGKAASQIRQLKSGMMDYIQKQIEQVEPNLPAEADVTRSVLRDWAVNEQQREIIERAFGASVGTPEFSQLSRVNPEKILDKVFSDTSHVKAAKQILSPSQFNEMRANYLASARQNVTRDGVFSSNKFKSFLDKKRYVLGEAMSDPLGQRQFQRIDDLNTTMRNFPDAAPTNNSKNVGEIQKIGEAIKDVFNGDWGNIVKEGKDKILSVFKENSQRKAINEALQGKPEKLRKFNAVKKMTDSVDDKVANGIRSIMLGGEQLSQKRRSQQGAQ